MNREGKLEIGIEESGGVGGGWEEGIVSSCEFVRGSVCKGREGSGWGKVAMGAVMLVGG